MSNNEFAVNKTTHTTQYTDALAGLQQLSDETIDLTVTSPPYPMIEMWDEIFASCDSQIKTAIEKNNWDSAYKKMHEYLNKIWNEVIRVTKPNRIIAINIGNATRQTNNSFKLYPNIQPIIKYFTNNGCEALPFIHWHKPSNKSSSFMGSGTLPTNAYVTNDHEYILLFRKGEGTREFPPKDTNRYQSTYFWEERNEWFSDHWTFQGTTQRLTGGERNRSGAFPAELPYRLINMYSVYGDTVLDPFLGTGTTQAIAASLGRNSYGFELDTALKDTLINTLNTLPDWSATRMNTRVQNHQEFTDTSEHEFSYTSPYGPVKTTYEKHIELPHALNTTINKDTETTLQWTTNLEQYTHNTT